MVCARPPGYRTRTVLIELSRRLLSHSQHFRAPGRLRTSHRRQLNERFDVPPTRRYPVDLRRVVPRVRRGIREQSPLRTGCAVEGTMQESLDYLCTGRGPTPYPSSHQRPRNRISPPVAYSTRTSVKCCSCDQTTLKPMSKTVNADKPAATRSQNAALRPSRWAAILNTAAPRNGANPAKPNGQANARAGSMPSCRISASKTKPNPSLATSAHASASRCRIGQPACHPCAYNKATAIATAGKLPR